MICRTGAGCPGNLATGVDEVSVQISTEWSRPPDTRRPALSHIAKEVTAFSWPLNVRVMLPVCKSANLSVASKEAVIRAPVCIEGVKPRCVTSSSWHLFS